MFTVIGILLTLFAIWLAARGKPYWVYVGVIGFMLCLLQFVLIF